jgi:hypothetical protein
MKTTYIVSGFMRSGTSMMMRALSEGGLEAVVNKNRDQMNQQWGDEYYQPNGAGFYELERKDYAELNFPKKYEGKLIKVLYGGLSRICAGDYKIVFMVRDPEEIRQSYEAFFNTSPPEVLKNYDKMVEYSIGIMEMRKDIQFEVINYRDVIEDSLGTFDNLYELGWEINPEKAATVVDPELFRFRREILTEGI